MSLGKVVILPHILCSINLLHSLKSELATPGDPSVALQPYVGHQVHHMGYIGKLL